MKRNQAYVPVASILELFEILAILICTITFFRLGLDTPGLLGLTHTTVDHVITPTRVKSIKSRIMDIAMGPNHTVLLTDQGKVITMGQNSDGQLGRGHSRSYSRSWPEIVKTMLDKEVTLIAAGASFTVVGKGIFNIH